MCAPGRYLPETPIAWYAPPHIFIALADPIKLKKRRKLRHHTDKQEANQPLERRLRPTSRYNGTGQHPARPNHAEQRESHLKRMICCGSGTCSLSRHPAADCLSLGVDGPLLVEQTSEAGTPSSTCGSPTPEEQQQHERWRVKSSEN